MKVEEPEPGHLKLSCDCGKPLMLKRPEFGMDCEDECSRKAFHADREKAFNERRAQERRDRGNCD